MVGARRAGPLRSRRDPSQRLPLDNHPKNGCRSLRCLLSQPSRSREVHRWDGVILGWRLVTGPEKCVAELLCPSHRIVRGEAEHFVKAILLAVERLGAELFPASGIA